MISFGLLFQPVLKVIENAFARDLGGIIQQYMGYRLGYERSRSRPTLSLRVGYSDTQLGHSTPVHRLAARTERESIRQSITLPAISCVVAAQRQLAALHRRNKFVSSRGWIEQDDQNVFFCWLDYHSRKQLMLLESESSVRERELLSGSATSLTQFPKRCLHSVDPSTRRGELLLVPWSYNPSTVLIFLLIPRWRMAKITKSQYGGTSNNDVFFSGPKCDFLPSSMTK